MKHTALRVGLQPAHPGQKGMKRQHRHGFNVTVWRPCPRYHLQPVPYDFALITTSSRAECAV
jgi:hypothetical protein